MTDQPIVTPVQSARDGLAPLQRLLLDLGVFVRTYEDVIPSDEAEEETGSIYAAFAECARAIQDISANYLTVDGAIPPGPVVLIETEDGVCEVGAYHYPVDVVHIDWDDVMADGESADGKRTEVRDSTLPAEVKNDLFDRLNRLV